jgi:PAS domain-containing protein
MAALDLVDSPVYVFDVILRPSIWYANGAAVSLWCAASLQELLERDFASDMSDSTRLRFDDYLAKFMGGQVLREHWTIYPKGTQAATVDAIVKGIEIEEGRVAMLVQATIQHTSSSSIDNDSNPQEESKMSLREQQALRATEMLRHLPVAVCLTDTQGNVLEQNPEAMAVFGSTTGGTSSDNDNSPEELEEHELAPQQATSVFVKRFVDRALGRRILEQVRTGKDVTLEALQHTVHGKRWAAIKVRQTKDPVTSSPILLYSARDITAVVEAKRQAATAELAKLDLIADMAHAIRTRLQHVVGVVELLSPPVGSPLLMTVIHDLMDTVSNNQDLMSSTNHHDNHRNKSNNHVTRDNHHHTKPRIVLEHTPLIIKEVLKNAVATIQCQRLDPTMYHSFSIPPPRFLFDGGSHSIGPSSLQPFAQCLQIHLSRKHFLVGPSIVVEECQTGPVTIQRQGYGCLLE